MNNDKIRRNNLVRIFIGLTIFLLLGGYVYTNASDLNTFLFGRTVHLVGAAASTTNPVGHPAMTPKKDPATTTGPTFTLDDAKAFIAAHPFHKGITTTGQPSSIDSIYFTTDKKVIDMTKGEDPGLSPDAQVLVVIEKGPFLLDNTAWPNGDPIPTANQIISVFDAHTGNLLLWGHWK